MKVFQIIILVVLFFLITDNSIAQQSDNQCGTSSIRTDWLNYFQENIDDFGQSRSDEWIVVKSVLHITGDDNGTGFLSKSQVHEAFVRLNEDLIQAKIQFYISQDINYIANTSWHTHESFGLGRAMMLANNVDNVVNLYFCANAAGNCGYYSPSVDALVIDDGCLGENSHTVSHEVGHYLSLPHTFDGWEGTDYAIANTTPTFIGGRRVEKVNGDNCSNSGDGFCDTPPDYLSFRWGCNADGESIEQIDPDGVTFRSPGDLIMSYSTGSCRGTFSEEQILTARANITQQRIELTQHNRAYKPLVPRVTLTTTYPNNLDTVYYQDVSLEWEDIPNVDHYIVTFASDYNLNNIIAQEMVTDSFFNVGDLVANKTYFWQVEPIALHSPSSKISKRRIFKTTEFSGNSNVDDAHEVRLFSENGILGILISGSPLIDAEFQLFDLSGRRLYTEKNPFVQGNHEINISTVLSANQIYVLNIQHSEGRIIEKVVLP